jgi:hypothetical protein
LNEDLVVVDGVAPRPVIRNCVLKFPLNFFQPSFAGHDDVFLVEGIVDHGKGEFDPHPVTFDEMFALADHKIDGFVIVKIDEP